MTSRRTGVRFNRTRIATSVLANPYDLRNQVGAANLVGYWDVPTANITMSPTLIASGTSPPALTVSGPGCSNATGRALWVRIDPTDATKFQWNFKNGWGVVRAADFGPGELSVPVPNGGAGGTYSVGSGSSQITITFPAGTYRTDNMWQACAQSIVGQVGGTLDNSSITAQKGHIIMGPQGFNNFCPSLRCTPFYGTGLMGQVGGIDTVFTGTNKPFHIFMVRRITQTNISTLPVAGWSFTNSTTTTGDFLDNRWYGPLSTTGPGGAGSQYILLRRSNGGAAQQQFFMTDLGFEPMVEEFSYDGTLANGYICGLPMFTGQAWSSAALVLQRFGIGAIKPGTGAVANASYMDWVTFAAYNQKLSDANAAIIRKALMRCPL